VSSGFTKKPRLGNLEESATHFRIQQLSTDFSMAHIITNRNFPHETFSQGGWPIYSYFLLRSLLTLEYHFATARGHTPALGVPVRVIGGENRGLTIPGANGNICRPHMTTSPNLGSAPHNGDAGVRCLDVILEIKVESADLAETLIYEFSKAEFGEDENHEIRLAVREAMVNAVLHGNRFDFSKKIFLSVELRAVGLVISIRDEGEGCEPESVPDPLASHNMLRESGRGMLLIRTCMDEVAWQRGPSGGTELVMAKYRSRTQAAPK
jgi:serine/threonine-protein kinase RsbW